MKNICIFILWADGIACPGFLGRDTKMDQDLGKEAGAASIHYRQVEDGTRERRGELN